MKPATRSIFWRGILTRAGSRRVKASTARVTIALRRLLGVRRIEIDALRPRNVGLARSGDDLGVMAGGHLRQRGHDALHIHHHQVHRAGEQRQLLVQVIARHRHSLAHQDFIRGAADAGNVDAFGARLARPRQQVLVAAGGHDHLAQGRLMAVHQDVDLLLFEHPEIGLRSNRLRAAEKHVLHVGGDHRPAPAVGQRGAHGRAQQRHRVRFHAVMGAVQQLDDLAVDAARGDADFVPLAALLLGRALHWNEGAFLEPELRRPSSRRGRRRSARRGDGPRRCPTPPPAPPVFPGFATPYPEGAFSPASRRTPATSRP